MKASPFVQKEIIEYSKTLHPSQRGLFTKSRNYSNTKKFFILLVMCPFSIRYIPKAESVLDVLIELDFRHEDGSVNEPGKSFLDFLEVLLLGPFILILIPILFRDLIKATLTWASATIEISSLMEGFLLGLVIEPSEEKNKLASLKENINDLRNFN